MPPLPRGYQPVPYASDPRYVPSYGTLGELMGLKARNSQQGWAQLAGAFDRFVQTKRAQEAQQLERADVMEQRRSADALKREEMAQRAAEREEAARLRKEAVDEKQQIAAEKRGDQRAKAIGYGPMAEADVDTVMQSPERSGDVRYSFGPGTADGPELQPTRDQQRTMELEKAVVAAGGTVGPNGSAHYPPKPPAPPAAPNIGSFEDYVTTKYGPRPTPQQIEQARRLYTDLGREQPAPPPPDGTLNPRQLSQTIQLSNSLKAHPAYTDMSDIATGLQGVTVGLSQENGFGDITAINAFQRMIDPGATVREGDVHLIRSASSWIDSVLSSYPLDRLRKGDKLPAPVRERMKKTARELYKVRSRNYNETVGTQYRKIADAAKIPFELIGSDFADAESLVGETAPAKPKVTRDAKGNLIAPPKGQK